MGMPSIVPHLRAENNDYKNPFGSEIALFRTNDGGMSRMAVCWDIPTHGGERGRVYGQERFFPGSWFRCCRRGRGRIALW